MKDEMAFAQAFMALCRKHEATAVVVVLEDVHPPGQPRNHVALTISGYPPLKRVVEDALKVMSTDNKRVPE